MIKLNAGFSRKVGEPNYGSRGASVNVELEVESGLIGDPDALMGRIRKLFDIARRSVDTELADDPTHSAPRPTGGQGNHSDQNTRYATSSQVRALHAIGNSQGVDPGQLASQKFGVGTLEQLRLRQASSLIDELKGNGGGSR
jgi:hypothetical protein